MSSWLESHTTLREHPKRKRLSRLLGLNMYEAIGLLHVLWWWVLEFAPEGDLRAFSDEDIADAIDFDGDAHALLSALVRSGFVDGDRVIHDWDEYAEKWIERRRANRERMRRARAERNGTADQHAFAHVARTSGARPAQNAESVGRPDQPDRTNQPTGPDQPDPTPQPPPLAEGAAMNSGRRRRRGVGGETPAPTSPPSEVTVLPPTEADVALWNLARGAASADMTPTNAGLLASLEPAGREASTGGLLLRAPPEAGDLGRFTGVLRVALRDAGDGRAASARILSGG